MPVHFAGQPCDMPAIHALSIKYNFKVIEDASLMLLGLHTTALKLVPALHSHITVFSFHPVKIITSGEGGVATTNDTLLAAQMRSLRSHGITNDKELMQTRAGNEIWNYQQIELGFNYRITDIRPRCSSVK